MGTSWLHATMAPPIHPGRSNQKKLSLSIHSPAQANYFYPRLVLQWTKSKRLSILNIRVSNGGIRNGLLLALLIVCVNESAPPLSTTPPDSRVIPDSIDPPSSIGKLAAIDANSSARLVVSKLHNALIAVMQAEGDFNQGYAQIEPVIESSFDAPLISKISVGRAWRNIEAQQREALVALMAQLITSTYVSRFKSFNNQRFEILEVRASTRGPIVRAVIHLRDDEPITLEYHTRNNKIYNVVANGVSDLSLKRADYAAVISNSGIAGLILQIQNSIDLYHDADL